MKKEMWELCKYAKKQDEDPVTLLFKNSDVRVTGTIKVLDSNQGLVVLSVYVGNRNYSCHIIDADQIAAVSFVEHPDSKIKDFYDMVP